MTAATSGSHHNGRPANAIQYALLTKKVGKIPISHCHGSGTNQLMSTVQQAMPPNFDRAGNVWEWTATQQRIWGATDFSLARLVVLCEVGGDWGPKKCAYDPLLLESSGFFMRENNDVNAIDGLMRGSGDRTRSFWGACDEDSRVIYTENSSSAYSSN
jgi:hypothetical protein